MQKTNFLDKFPVISYEIKKDQTSFRTTDEIIEFFKSKVQNHKIARYIEIFDHFSHTKALGGEIVEGLVNAKNIIFCFGQAIPNPKILAIRPRSIGVCEFEDRFSIDFMEAPKEDLTKLMQSWVEELILK